MFCSCAVHIFIIYLYYWIILLNGVVVVCVCVCVFFHFDFNFIRYWMYGKVKICLWSFFAYIVYFLNYDKILIFSCILSITVIFYYIFSLIYHFVTCQCVKICACACVWSYSIRIWKNILNQNLNIQKK